VLAGAFDSKWTVSNNKLNDDRQGEGGTLAVIEVNITTRIYFMQVFSIRKRLTF
jgi:hypothetical protein